MGLELSWDWACSMNVREREIILMFTMLCDTMRQSNKTVHKNMTTLLLHSNFLWVTEFLKG